MTDGFWVGPETAPDTYTLVSMIGGGGEGEVWKAVLPLSEDGRRTVAIKITCATGDPEESERWEQTKRLMRALSHPGLVRVTDVFAGPGMHRAGERAVGSFVYVVMDYVEGTSLTEWVVENPDATASQRLGMLRMVAAALDDMHAGATTEVAVTHGDVKPANIVIGRTQGAVLVDLGLAQLADSAGTAGHSAPYAAPELHISGALPTPATDRYAFAVTVAHILTGTPPPLGSDGWLDPAALETQLRQNTLTNRRHALIQQIMSVIAAPPDARPHGLRQWLDSTVNSLSQITGPARDKSPEPAGPHAGASESSDHVIAHSERDPGTTTSPYRSRLRAILIAVLVLLTSSAAMAGAAAIWPRFTGAATENTSSGLTGAPSPGPLPSASTGPTGPDFSSTQPPGLETGANSSGSIEDIVTGGPPRSIPNISVPPLAPVPVILPALQLATKSLPPLMVGTAWTATFDATGGTAPYRWAVSGGALPQGFVLQESGQINGTARTPSPSTFTVEVTDAAGTTASRQFSVTPIAIIGDLNRDGQVDCADQNILMSQWQQTGPGHSGDLNQDDIVNTTDLSIMLSHWTGSSTSC